MDKAMDFLMNNWLAGIAAVCGWAFGFASDVGKEHWRRKREIKEEHAKTIQKEILVPIYEFLKSFYIPVSELREPSVCVVSESLSKDVTHITEEAYAGVRFALRPRTPERPADQFFQTDYWHETEGFKRYYKDAKDVHYTRLLTRLELFRNKFMDMQQESLTYSNELVKLLKAELKMEPFSPMGLPKVPWANYERIAYVIFKRHMGLVDEGIRFDSYTVGAKTSKTQEDVFKCGSALDAQKALETVNGIPKNNAAIDKIKTMCKDLSVEADFLLNNFRFEISKAPEPRHCQFV